MDNEKSGQMTGHIERASQRVGGVGGKNGAVAALLVWGNHHFVISLWAVIGLVSAMLAPALFLEDEHDIDRVYLWMACSGIFTCGMYVMGYLLRDTPIMRERRIWIQNALGNCFASAIAIAVVVKLNSTPNSVVGFMLVAVAVFGFMEIAKPVYDFELLQFFLRLPLQMAVVCYRHHPVGWHILAAALLLAFGTIWHDFFMQIMPVQRPVQKQPPPPEGLVQGLPKTI